MSLFRSRPARSWFWLGLFAGATTLAARLGRSARTAPRRPWYRLLSKPPGQPPAWVFGPVWTALYALMSTSATRVFRAPPSAARSRALALWWAQLALNAAWSPLFFGKHRARVALADLAGITATTAGYVAVVKDIDRPAAWMMAPYLGWLGFAGYLNGAIVARNRLLA
jgi:benzodiazapine receptor